MSKASDILDFMEVINIQKKTRKPSKKKREAGEKRIAQAEKEREQWREKTFPKPPFKRAKNQKWTKED